MSTHQSHVECFFNTLFFLLLVSCSCPARSVSQRRGAAVGLRCVRLRGMTGNGTVGVSGRHARRPSGTPERERRGGGYSTTVCVTGVGGSETRVQFGSVVDSGSRRDEGDTEPGEVGEGSASGEHGRMHVWHSRLRKHVQSGRVKDGVLFW